MQGINSCYDICQDDDNTFDSRECDDVDHVRGLLIASLVFTVLGMIVAGLQWYQPRTAQFGSLPNYVSPALAYLGQSSLICFRSVHLYAYLVLFVFVLRRYFFSFLCSWLFIRHRTVLHAHTVLLLSVTALLLAGKLQQRLHLGATIPGTGFRIFPSFAYCFYLATFVAPLTFANMVLLVVYVKENEPFETDRGAVIPSA